MKKGLDSEIMLELLQLAIEEKIDFKKWFQDEQMTLEAIPVSIYEIMKVLPRQITLGVNAVGIEEFFRLSIYWQSDILGWYVGYQGSRWLSVKRELELVDALGKLLIWAIQEGWLG